MNLDRAFLGALGFGRINREQHRFAKSTFVDSLTEIAESPASARVAFGKIIHRVLVDPRTVSVVAFPCGYPDEQLGWAASVDGVLVFVYVRYHFRRKGLGTMLAAQVVDADGPIRLAYWTRAAGRMALGGYPIIHDVCAQSELARFAR